MTERIDHAKDALDRVINLETAFAPIKDRNIDIRVVANLNANAMRELAIAQVHATLALVEQQRIANLIQLMHVPVGKLSEDIKDALHQAFRNDRDWEAELNEGLGLS